MSGAGRSTAANTLEDLGWYVVDNLPPTVLPEVCEQARRNGIDPARRGAGRPDPVVLRAAADHVRRAQRGRHHAGDPVPGGRRRRDRPSPGVGPPAAPAAGRRPAAGRHHPGAGDPGHPAGRRRPGDRHVLAQHPPARAPGSPTRTAATDDDQLRVTLLSFGFKNGIPVDADMVFDVRFLPNPHWVPELRPQTGLSQPVSEYVLGQAGAEAFLDAAAGAAVEVIARATSTRASGSPRSPSAAPAASTAARRWPRSSPAGCAQAACRPRSCTATWAGNEPARCADGDVPALGALASPVDCRRRGGVRRRPRSVRVAERAAPGHRPADRDRHGGRRRRIVRPAARRAQLPAAGRSADGPGRPVRRRRVRPHLGRRAAVPVRRRPARSATTRSATC